MANTVIALKKSATPAAAPASLANGELAINYADGKLFYKNVGGQIIAITSGTSANSFATINANGSLITAISNNSTLTFVAGSGIGITSDIINDIITISSTVQTTNVVPAFNQANQAYLVANAAFTQDNLVFATVNAAFSVANAANGWANTVAFRSANNANIYGMTYANATFLANTSGVTFNGSLNISSNLTVTSNVTAGNISVTGTASYIGANSVAVSGNVAVGRTTYNYPLDVVGIANVGNLYINGVDAIASGNGWANNINTAVYTVFPAVNNFVVAAITSNTAGANGWANNVNTYSGLTYVKLTAASQTITGDLSITGNLTLLGNSTVISSNSLIVGDSLIYLAANNYSGTDIIDIGFVANYGNTTGANVHTGLIRDATTKQYYLFNGLDIELQANNTAFTPGANGVINAALNADLITSNLTLGGANAITTIVNNAAGANGWANNINTATQNQFGAVNNYITTSITSNTAGANGWANNINTATQNQFGAVNNYITVSITSNTAGANGWTNSVAGSINTAHYSYANTISNTIGGIANVKLANVSISSPLTATFATTSGNTTATVGLGTIGPGATTTGGSGIASITTDVYGRITSIATATYLTTAVTSVSGSTGTITSTGGTTPVINLATTAVTASTYGGATQIPYFAVDSYGRLTTAGNVAISAGGSTVGNETVSASTYYPVFTTTTSGSMSSANVNTSYLTFVPSTGTLGAKVFNSLSDITLKTDIQGFDGEILLNKIDPKSFNWKDTGTKSYGVIAQELEKVLPELVDTAENGLKSVSYIPMIAMLIDVVKKQQHRIEEIEKKLGV